MSCAPESQCYNAMVYQNVGSTSIRSVAPFPLWAEGDRPCLLWLEEQLRLAEVTAKNLGDNSQVCLW